jgi:hypothetical protein
MSSDSGLFLGGIIDASNGERTGDDVRLDPDNLTTHGVIVGMTGSGKTGLGVVLIEEVLGSGRPVLMIDPKGDLTNLKLAFADFAAADFEPWVDEAQARNEGIEVSALAANQAEVWRAGLEGWGIGTERVRRLAEADVTIYTPGSQSGVALNLVGSLNPPGTDDAEIVADEIEGYVSGLLGLVGIAADPLSSREHILLSNLIDHAWRGGRSIDLATLVAMVQQPPLRKLGVFELDEFFAPKDRTAFAVRLNGLLASPSFAAWGTGVDLDIETMLRAPDGSARAAIVTTAHLSDDERQFVTSLVLSKLVTWMRRQSGTSDLRVLVYMDEVHGYLPPTANPPTKKPIMTLMKTARAFGVGVVLSTQNPVDIDYKAISNAGVWMIGRLQTERDKARLLDGMKAAAGGVDTGAIGDAISALGKRQFVMRRASKDTPEVFTTRWAMSYLAGPMTRDQIASVTPAESRATAPSVTAETDPGASTATASQLGDDESIVMPTVTESAVVRYVDRAAPWLADVGGDETAVSHEAAVIARVVLGYNDAKAEITHDEEYEAVFFPITERLDGSEAIAVDYDDRDLRTDPPDGIVYRLPHAPVGRAAWFSGVERALIDHLTRTQTLEIAANEQLKVWARIDESAETFADRCRRRALDEADREIAALRDKYEQRALKLRDQIEAAEDQAGVLQEQARGRRNSELLSTAGSILGGLLGGKKSAGAVLGSTLGRAGTAAGRRGTTAASAKRTEAALNKVARLSDDLERLEQDLADEIDAISTRWTDAAADIGTTAITLRKADVRVVAMCLAWIPVR